MFRHSLCRPFSIIAVIGLFTLSASSVQAQSGSFLESLFRSIAEKQLQQAAESNRRPVPPPGFPGSGPRPPASQPRPPAHSHDVHQFDVTLTQFHHDLGSLMQLVQNAARSNVEYRSQLPTIYQLQAEVGALASRAESAPRLEPLIGAYRGIDQRYRELSFRLRAVPDRDSAMRAQIARCDATVRTLGKICGIDAQFDRHGLHDQMLIAATYIQTLIDDLPTARVHRDQSRSSVHQARSLHSELENGEPLERLQRSAGRLISAWKSMSAELDHLDRHGLTSSRALALQRQQQQMLPLVASLTAALLQETP